MDDGMELSQIDETQKQQKGEIAETLPETSSFSLDRTARGRPLIIFQGYEHRQVRVDRARNLKAYRCIKKKCKGRLHTDFDDKNARIVSEHVHEPNFDAEFKRRRRTLLRELAQKGNVSPSQIIQKARDLELQYHDICANKTSYAAERRYIQRYWNRQKQQEFADGVNFLRNQLIPGDQIKVEQELNDEGTGGELAGTMSSFSCIPAQTMTTTAAVEQFNQFLQMTTNDGTNPSCSSSSSSSNNNNNNSNSESSMNVYLNILLQHMLTNVAGCSSSGSSNGSSCSSSGNISSIIQEKDASKKSMNPKQAISMKSLVNQASMKINRVDVAVQTHNDEFAVRGYINDGLIRDTVAVELGTIIAKNFWPEYYSREDKLKLMIDVIAKLLSCY